MSYELTCRDVGGDCDFGVSGTNPNEVKRAMWAHAKQDHGETFSRLTPGMRADFDRRMDERLGVGGAA